MKLRLVMVLAGMALASPAAADDAIPGPIPARVVSVYDGDTLTVDAEVWPGITIRTAVRLDGVDTPEIRGKCQAEKDLAVRARDFVRATVGERVYLINVRPDKYGGRVGAGVVANGEMLATILIVRGFARPYDGGRRGGWC